MSEFFNELGQPIGFPVDGWQGARHPRDSVMEGRLCRLRRLDPAVDAEPLWQAFGLDTAGRNWTYLPYGPFASAAQLRAWMESDCGGDDPCFFAVVDRESGFAAGVASYLRIDPGPGVIEVGHIHFSPLMQRSPLATEAMYLMMKTVFEELDYRRYEWKCDALNAPSRRAAERLGFLQEGLFRQATMYKRRNRDTAWYAILDREWPSARAAFEAWLDPANFTPDGEQRSSLRERMRAALAVVR